MHEEGAPRGFVTEVASQNAADRDDLAEPPPATRQERVVLAGLGFAAFLWIAIVLAVALSLIGKGPIDGATIVRGISFASGPLALLVAVLILWQRNSARTAQRYADAARLVRRETLALDTVLSLTSHRLAEDRAAVAEQADRMVMLADDTSTRMRAVTDALKQGIAELGRHTEGLEMAAGSARVDLGVILSDLPRAEEQTRALADSIRATGLGAHEQAAALEAVLGRLAEQARDAEEQTGGAASRLSAQSTQIATVSDLATRSIDEARQRMSESVEGVLARTVEAAERTRQSIGAQAEAIDALIDRTNASTDSAVERVRRGIAEQDALVDALVARAAAAAEGAMERTSRTISTHDDAISAMVERARLAAEAASANASQAVQAQIDLLSQEVERVAERLGAQDATGSALVERIQRGLAHVEGRFAELEETGRARTTRLVEALGVLVGHAERTLGTLNAGGTAATTLINRAETLKGAIVACVDELGGTLPDALGRLEGGAARSLETVERTTPEVEKLHSAARQAAEALDGARMALDERGAAIDTLADAIEARIAAAQDSADSLREAVSGVDAQVVKLADSTSPKLVDALIQVRETAGQAAERARQALGTIIPGTAEALGKAGRAALERAVSNEIEGQIARLTAASDLAVEASRAAGARLEEQLGRIADTSARVGGEIAAGRSSVEEADRDNFSRQVAALIEALNTTAVDVTKLLSTDPSDEAWQAYLRGDRGTFTRRAVKLLDATDAREIARLYGQQPHFREQVNRYITDFERMLRPILATRDGSTLAVVMLSSNMGKLYVALAQAIERLRT
jgi:hypothetical protein